jgi:hypothetical protein
MQYSEDPHSPSSTPPQRADGSLAFEQLLPEHRRDYLDGWSAATIGGTSPRTVTSERFFKAGVIEARGHAAMQAGA